MDKITIEWDDDAQSIIRTTIGRDWVWKDLQQADEGIVRLADTVKHGVSYITHFLPESTIPLGSPVTSLRYMMKFRHANSQIVVFVGARRFFKLLISTVGRIHKLPLDNIFYADTLEEARRIISEWRSNMD